MTISRIGRTLLRLPYQAATLPLRIAEQQITPRLLGEESGLRIGLQKMVGTLDSMAGQLLADQSLQQRGQRVQDTSRALERANALEHRAERRREQADRHLNEESERARERREAARRGDDRVQQALRERREDTQVVNEIAEREAREARRAADAKADRRKQQARDKQQSTEKTTEAHVARSTATPKNQLKQAAEEKKAAQHEKKQANDLESLTEQKS